MSVVICQGVTTPANVMVTTFSGYVDSSPLVYCKKTIKNHAAAVQAISSNNFLHRFVWSKAQNGRLCFTCGSH